MEQPSSRPHPPPGGAVAGLGAAVTNAGLPLEGLRLLLRERRLWRLALVPLLLSVMAVGSTLAGVVSWAGEIHAFATDWLPVLEAGVWYTWLWIGPARLLLGALGLGAFLALVGLALVLAYLVASLLASPFHDVLSRRVESLVSGRVVEVSEEGFLAILRQGGRALREESRRLLFFLGVQGGIALLGFLIPGGQLVAGPAMALFAMLFLPLDYASYTLDRQQIPFREKRRWVLDRPGAMLGFGAAAFGLCLVPGVNLLAMPVLVVAGTLLALRHPPLQAD